MKQVYLSGASRLVEDEGKGWVHAAEQLFLDTNWKPFIPQDHFDYTLYPPKTDRECRKLFEYGIKQSDVMLVNLNQTKYSPGTAYEVGYANALGKPIIGFDGSHYYGWTKDSCHVILEDLESAVMFILQHYS